MALIQPSGTPAPPGKSGGVVSYPSSTGSALRANGVQHKSPFRDPVEVNINTSMLYAYFANRLSPAEQAAWNYYAMSRSWIERNGSIVNLSGRTWFMVTNRVRQRIGLPIFESLAGNPNTSSFGAVVVAISTTTITVTITPGGFPPDVGPDGFELWANKPTNSAVNQYGQQRKKLGTVTGPGPHLLHYPNPWECVSGIQQIVRGCPVFSSSSPIQQFLSSAIVT